MEEAHTCNVADMCRQRQVLVNNDDDDAVAIHFFFLRMRLRYIVGQPGNSSSISRVELGQTTVQLRKRTGFDDVGHRLGFTTGAQISVCKTPSLSGTETAQKRPLLSWEGETRLPD